MNTVNLLKLSIKGSEIVDILLSKRPPDEARIIRDKVTHLRTNMNTITGERVKIPLNEELFILTEDI